MTPFQPHRVRPPWWPQNEPWPPYGRHHWRSRRRHFARRLGITFAAFLLLSLIGASSVMALLFNRTGWVGFIVVGGVATIALFFGVMRRVGMPFSDIVSGANRVAQGDFSVRLREAGPPFLRSVAGAFNTMTGRLQAQDKQRRQLMADIAHELRTPLAVIQGRIEGILDGVYGRDDEHVRQLLEETKVLSRLVDDLRTLADAESGMLVLQRESVDLDILIRDVLTSLRPHAETAHVALNQDRSADVPLVELDPLRMREVLTNLVSNAIVHTPAGGTVSISDRREGENVVIRVADTGSGISVEDLPKIFDRFYKGRDSRGSGLGLTIARRLVLAHGGEIHAASQVGVGTTMTVMLPA